MQPVGAKRLWGGPRGPVGCLLPWPPRAGPAAGLFARKCAIALKNGPFHRAERTVWRRGMARFARGRAGFCHAARRPGLAARGLMAPAGLLRGGAEGRG